MSRASAAGNGVMRAVEDYCGLYRVPCFRMQSRVFRVAGVNGKDRPMFIGGWTDLQGNKHAGGMADLLLTPRLDTGVFEAGHPPGSYPVKFKPTVALWVECKAGAGRLSAQQILFRDFILATQGYYLLIQDNPEVLLEWFKKHKVTM